MHCVEPCVLISAQARVCERIKPAGTRKELDDYSTIPKLACFLELQELLSLLIQFSFWRLFMSSEKSAIPANGF